MGDLNKSHTVARSLTCASSLRFIIISVSTSHECCSNSTLTNIIRVATVVHELIVINNANVIHEFIIFNIINDVIHGDIIGVTSQQIGIRMFPHVLFNTQPKAKIHCIRLC